MLVPLQKLKQFFELIIQRAYEKATPIHIFCSLKTDTVCAFRILKELLTMEQVLLELHPVQGYGEMMKITKENLLQRLDELHTIICINCGANYDINQVLFGEEDPPDGVNIYIADHNRPIALENIHNNLNVYVLDDRDEGTDLNAYPVPLSEDEESEEESDSSLGFSDADDVPPRKKRRLLVKDDPVRAEKRRRKAEIDSYYKLSYWGKPTSHLFYELARDMKKSDNNLLWLSIIGLTDMFINDRMDRLKYDMSLRHYREEVLRLNPVHHNRHIKDYNHNVSTRLLPGSESLTMSSVPVAEQPSNISDLEGLEDTCGYRKKGHIKASKEFQFFLMRHWTLYDSMYYSRYVATKLNVWRHHGSDSLKHMLVKWGIKLREAKQPYRYMFDDLKRKLITKLEEPDAFSDRLGKMVVYDSFTRQNAEMESICAADLVRSVDGILEDDQFLEHSNAKSILNNRKYDEDFPVSVAMEPVDPEVYERSLNRRWNQNFADAISVLSGLDNRFFERGLKLTIERQQEIVDMGTRLVEKRQIAYNGFIRWAEIQQKNNFTNPVALSKLALFIVNALRERFPNRPKCPFILSSLCSVRDCFVVVGVATSNRMGTIVKNSFGSAFSSAREIVKARTKHMGFETWVIEVQKEDLKRFIEEVHRQICL